MSKVIVQYSDRGAIEHIEGFPEQVAALSEKGEPKKDKDGNAEMRTFERSVEGALHFLPGSTKELTNDELDFLKANRKTVAAFLRILEVPKAPEPAPKMAELDLAPAERKTETFRSSATEPPPKK